MLSNGIQSGSFVGCDSEIMCFCYWAVRICSSVCGVYLATAELWPCMYYFYSSCQLSWTYNLLPVSVWAEKMLQKHFPGDLLWTTDWNEKIWNKSGYKTVVYVYIFCFCCWRLLHIALWQSKLESFAWNFWPLLTMFFVDKRCAKL